MIASGDWNDMVSDQKGHSTRHESGGVDEVNHDSLTNFVANEHIDHSSVSISAGTHLTGGGDLTSSRTLDVDETGIDVENLSSQGASGTVPVSQGDGSLAMELVKDADTVDGSNVFVQDSQPTAENTGDIWIATGGNL